MVRFIRQEADEKASEIAVSTEEEVGGATRAGGAACGAGDFRSGIGERRGHMSVVPSQRPRRAPGLQFNISKIQLLEAEKQRIKSEFERREAAIQVKKKVRGWLKRVGQASSLNKACLLLSRGWWLGDLPNQFLTNHTRVRRWSAAST